MIRLRIALIAAAISTLVILNGCGGGGSNLGSVRGTGRATFTMVWPPSRLIPAASNSIQVVIKDGNTSIASQTLPRPSGGGPATATFNSLPVGSLTATATAYPNADATGVAQATATVPLQIADGQNTHFALTMASTIDHVELGPQLPTISPGSTLQFNVVAKDGAGNIVLTAPSKISWASSNASATINGTGLLTAVSPGAPVITVTDTESGKSATSTVAIPVSWWKAEGNAADSAGGNNGTIYGAVGFTPGVVGWDPLESTCRHASLSIL